MTQLKNNNPAQKEDVKHGDYIFPIQKYRTALGGFYAVVPPHWHEESEFTIIRKGTCHYHINLDEEDVFEGDILFISPLMLHSATCPKSLASTKKSNSLFMESDTFVFHLNFLGSNTTDICSMRYLTPLQNQEFTVPSLIRSSHPAYIQVRSIFDDIDLLYREETPGYELEIKSLLLKLLFILFQYRTNQEISALSPTNVEKIRKVLSFIEEHYEESLSIEELCRLCYFSKYHFMRFFKQHTGMTCIEYINNLRLEKATELFEQGHTSVLDVSLSVGFHNVSYFHRAFLKKYHITPKTLLKQFQNASIQ